MAGLQSFGTSAKKTRRRCNATMKLCCKITAPTTSKWRSRYPERGRMENFFGKERLKHKTFENEQRFDFAGLRGTFA